MSRIFIFSMLFAVSLTAQAWQIDRTFDVKSGGSLTIDTDVGSIEVDTHASETIEVEIHVDGLDEDELKLSFDQSGDDLRIKADTPAMRGWRSHRGRQVEFIVTVPEQYNADLSTAGGSISVENLEGSVDVDTSGGSLNFRNIVGDVRGHTSGGSIDVDELDGELRVSTSGGSIDIHQVTRDVEVDTSGGTIDISEVGGRVEAETSGGSIRLENIAGGIDASTSGGSVRARLPRQPSGDVSLSTSGGGVSVRLGDDVAMRLQAKANRIYSDFEVDGKNKAKRRLNGDINGGGPVLELRSSGGSVSVERI